MRTSEKGRFLGSNAHMQSKLDIERYLEHYTDQKGGLLISARPLSSRKCSLSWTFAFKFASQYPPFISKKGSHPAQDNECTIESTYGSGYVYIFTGNSYYMGSL